MPPLTPEAQAAADTLTQLCETLFALIAQAPERSDELAQQLETKLLEAKAIGVCPKVIISRLRARLAALLQQATGRRPSPPHMRARQIKPLPERIEATTAYLAQLHARQRLIQSAEKARARKQEKREQAKTLSGLLRSADSHRKIALGGVVIAAGADGLDPAELCGWLIAVLSQRARTPDAANAMRESGLQKFSEREAARRKDVP